MLYNGLCRYNLFTLLVYLSRPKEPAAVTMVVLFLHHHPDVGDDQEFSPGSALCVRNRWA